MSSCTRLALLPPRHIPSPTHFPDPTTRTSAGFFAAPAGVVGAASSGCLVALGVQLSLVVDGSFDHVVGLGSRTAIRVRLSGSMIPLCTHVNAPLFDSQDRVGPHVES